MTVTAPAAPRALTPPEKAELRARLEARLREAGEGDAADDEGLLAFVLDMAENREAVGRVPEELLKLEMCREAEAEKIGACLAEFFDSLEARQQGLQAETTPVTMSGQHRANSSTSAPGGRVRVEVTKPTKDCRLGIGFTPSPGGRRFIVTTIADDGLFAGTSLKEGMVLQSINGRKVDADANKGIYSEEIMKKKYLQEATGKVVIVATGPPAPVAPKGSGSEKPRIEQALNTNRYDELYTVRRVGPNTYTAENGDLCWNICLGCMDQYYSFEIVLDYDTSCVEVCSTTPAGGFAGGATGMAKNLSEIQDVMNRLEGAFPGWQVTEG